MAIGVIPSVPAENQQGFCGGSMGSFFVFFCYFEELPGGGGGGGGGAGGENMVPLRTALC